MNEEREYHSPKDSIDTKLYPLLSSGHLFLLFGTALLSLYDQAQVKLLNFAVLPPLPVPELSALLPLRPALLEQTRGGEPERP